MLPSIKLESSEEAPNLQLRLSFGGKEVVMVTNSKVKATLGRADENDLVIKGKLISRIHARVEITKRHITLTDESTNGTFVQRDDGEEFYVRRDTAELSGSGIISLGKVASKGSDLAIDYIVES